MWWYYILGHYDYVKLNLPANWKPPCDGIYARGTKWNELVRFDKDNNIMAPAQ